MQAFKSKPVVETLDSSRILRLLPHRYPFLFVDRYHVLEAGKEGVGIKNVSFNEAHFVGHFPEEPVMPGVLTVEAVAQSSALLAVAGVMEDEPKGVFLMSIDRARFRRIVTPGDQLVIHVEMVSSVKNVRKLVGAVTVDDKAVAEVTLTAMIRDRTPAT